MKCRVFLVRLKQRTNLFPIDRVSKSIHVIRRIDCFFFSFVCFLRYKTIPLFFSFFLSFSLSLVSLGSSRFASINTSRLFPLVYRSRLYSPNSPKGLSLSLVKYNFSLYAYKFVIYICVVIK